MDLRRRRPPDRRVTLAGREGTWITGAATVLVWITVWGLMMTLAGAAVWAAAAVWRAVIRLLSQGAVTGGAICW